MSDTDREHVILSFIECVEGRGATWCQPMGFAKAWQVNIVCNTDIPNVALLISTPDQDDQSLCVNQLIPGQLTRLYVHNALHTTLVFTVVCNNTVEVPGHVVVIVSQRF